MYKMKLFYALKMEALQSHIFMSKNIFVGLFYDICIRL